MNTSRWNWNGADPLRIAEFVHTCYMYLFRRMFRRLYNNLWYPLHLGEAQGMVVSDGRLSSLQGGSFRPAGLFGLLWNITKSFSKYICWQEGINLALVWFLGSYTPNVEQSRWLSAQYCTFSSPDGSTSTDNAILDSYAITATTCTRFDSYAITFMTSSIFVIWLSAFQLVDNFWLQLLTANWSCLGDTM